MAGLRRALVQAALGVFVASGCGGGSPGGAGGRGGVAAGGGGGGTGSVGGSGGTNHPPQISSAGIASGNGVDTCTPAALTVTAQDPDGDALSYGWTVVDGPTGGATITGNTSTVVFSASVAGVYSVKVTVNDGRGASTSLTFTVTVSSASCAAGSGGASGGAGGSAGAGGSSGGRGGSAGGSSGSGGVGGSAGGAGSGGSGGGAGASGGRGGIGGSSGSGGAGGSAGTGSSGGTSGSGGSGGSAGGANGGGGQLGTAGAGGAGGLTTFGPLTCSGTVLGMADFDGDGTTDCAVAVQVNPPLAGIVTLRPVFLKGLGAGAFSQTGIVGKYSFHEGGNAISTADLGGDGLADLVIRDPSSGGAVVSYSYLKGQADGVFRSGSVVQFPPSGYIPTTMVIVAGPLRGDFNGDGKPDLLLAAWQQSSGQAGQSIYWLFISDAGSSSMSSGIGTGSRGNVGLANAPADFNGDGKLDVAATVYSAGIVGQIFSQDVIIVWGHGDGTFSAPVDVPGTTGATAVAVSDLNADGKVDLNVTVEDDTTMPVSLVSLPLYGDGMGKFSTTAP